MRLLLVRHGQTDWNAARRFQGRSDVGLSDHGRRQAQALGRGLAGYRIAAAYTSPLARARDTAALALGGRGVSSTEVPALAELSLGEWEGRTVDEVRSAAGDPYAAWLRAPADAPPPGGEGLGAVRDRVVAAFEAIGRRHAGDADVLVVAHGGVISVYACALLECSFNRLWRLRVDNASLTIVRPPRLVTLNDTRHLAGL